MWSFCQVDFNICECRKNNTKNATNVRVINTAGKEYGFVASIQNNSGRIESADHEKVFSFKYVPLFLFVSSRPWRNNIRVVQTSFFVSCDFPLDAA